MTFFLLGALLFCLVRHTFAVARPALPAVRLVDSTLPDNRLVGQVRLAAFGARVLSRP